MEKPICNSQPIDVVFYGVQPISIKDELWLDLFAQKYDFESIKGCFQKNIDQPKWFSDFTRLNELYRSIIVLKDEPVSLALLKQEIDAAFPVNANHFLGQYLNVEKTTAYLTLDLRFMYFILVYEIHFSFDAGLMQLILEKPAFEDVSFYGAVRNLIVKEHEESRISAWGETVRDNSIKYVEKIISQSTGLEAKSGEIDITYNSGNITCVVNSHCIDDKLAAKIGQKFVSANNAAERLQHENEYEQDYNKIMLGKYRFYLFNGRFHTIFQRDSLDLYRYIPIQYHMQYLWFFLIRINNMLEKINANIVSNTAARDLSIQARIVDEVINKVEVLTLHNENFKFSIESDNKRIFSKIEGNWNLELLLSNSNRYASFFKGYLGRLHARKNAKSESRQNGILFFISIIQLITIISVWNDYLALIGEQTVVNAKNIMFLFGNAGNMKIFNFILPLGLLVTLIILLGFIFHARGKED